MMRLRISETLKDLPTINSNDLWDLQGNLKDLSKINYDKLKQSLEENGFIVPLFVWFDDSNRPFTLDGNQRLRVITSEIKDGVELPFIRVEAKDRNDAKQKILLISSQYGKTTKDGFDEFTAEMQDFDVFVAESTTFVDFLDAVIDEKEERAGVPKKQFIVHVECEDERSQEELFDELTAKGYQCKILGL